MICPDHNLPLRCAACEALKHDAFKTRGMNINALNVESIAATILSDIVRHLDADWSNEQILKSLQTTLLTFYAIVKEQCK
jgi:hypothetical protein